MQRWLLRRLVFDRPAVPRLLVLQVKVDLFTWVSWDLAEYLLGRRQVLLLRGDIALHHRALRLLLHDRALHLVALQHHWLLLLLHGVLGLGNRGLLNGILALSVLNLLLDGVLLLVLNRHETLHLIGILFVACWLNLLLSGIQAADAL